MGYFIASAKFLPFNWGSRTSKKPMGSEGNLLLDDNCALSQGQGSSRSAVPKGYIAVYVGEEMKRFVIPARYICLPPFRALMEKVAEEFGFDQEGGLRIPCIHQKEFDDMINILQASISTNKKKMKSKRNQPKD